MPDVIDWIRETSRYMAKVRSDIYTESSAASTLTSHMDYLRNNYSRDNLSVVMSGGFLMLRIVEDEGMEEFQVAQFISSATTFQPEEDCLVLGFNSDEISLPMP